MDRIEESPHSVPDAYDRIRDLMHHQRINQVDLANELGVAQSVVSRAIRGHTGFDTHWVKISNFFNISLDWLLRGREYTHPRAADQRVEHSPATKELLPVAVRDQGTVYISSPKRISADTDRPEYVEGDNNLPLTGTVAAGSELISYIKHPRVFKWKPSWSVMRVEGTSAYPVVYPNQFVIVDNERPIRHNNLIVVETEEPDDKGGTIRNAYLKRYCVDPRAPSGYVLASVNAGIDSPYIPHEHILVKVPVVGVLFEEG